MLEAIEKDGGSIKVIPVKRVDNDTVKDNRLNLAVRKLGLTTGE